jgi:hypothetical protein
MRIIYIYNMRFTIGRAAFTDFWEPQGNVNAETPVIIVIITIIIIGWTALCAP